VNPADPPLVSVIIPSYNHASYIGKAIQSVLNQTYSNLEIIVVDNHSQDNTLKVINSFNSKVQIRFMEIRNNGVIAASRNMGIKEARGEWIAFLDSDDTWLPEKIEKVVAAASSGLGFDVVCHNEYKVFENLPERKELRHGPYVNDFYKALLTGGNRLSTSATVVRRSFLEINKLHFNEAVEFVTVEDYALWLDLARAGARFKFIEDFLGEYFIHSSNNSGSLQRHWKNNENLVHFHLFSVQDFTDSPSEIWTRLKAKYRLSQLKQSLVNRQLFLALRLFARVIFESPFDTLRYLHKRNSTHIKKY
jgi:glycosyltransferase involved in cell wall biosynthesis